MLPPGSDLASVRTRFRWDLPARLNMGWDVCDKWARSDPDRIALILDEEDRTLSFDELRSLSNRLANLMAARGVRAGDRVGVLMPQRWEAAAAHVAAWKIGAVSIPLFALFGAEALGHRLRDSGARLVVTDGAGAAKLAALDLPALAHVLDADGDLPALMAAQGDGLTPADTGPDDPAVLIYTSGTTGPPKGALHAHRVLAGHLPGVEMSHGGLPEPGDLMWTPADWAWIGGLLDVLMPALHHGIPVVARRFAKFTGEAAFDLMHRRGVRNAFLPPTALKMMRGVADPPAVDPRSIASGGESLGAELLAWGREVFGVTIAEFYGQTECNMVVSSAPSWGAHRPGVMGWPVPGHEVAVLGEDHTPVTGEEGEIAVRLPDPVAFLGYWNQPEATAAKTRGGWLRTGDRGIHEPDGALRYVGRDDDVISSAGYRIGPGEVEDCLLRHPAVAMAGVVGKPDDLRGQIVKAYVVLAEGHAPSDTLAGDIAGFVKHRLAAHEYPREVAFLDALPMTTTGKIVRAELRRRAEAET